MQKLTKKPQYDCVFMQTFQFSLLKKNTSHINNFRVNSISANVNGVIGTPLIPTVQGYSTQ